MNQDFEAKHQFGRRRLRIRSPQKCPVLTRKFRIFQCLRRLIDADVPMEVERLHNFKITATDIEH